LTAEAKTCAPGRSASLGALIFRWDGELLVQDNYVRMLLATSLDVSRNRIIIGENIDESYKYGFFNHAVVLTYPGPAGSNDR
jgi:hypothetical protein